MEDNLEQPQVEVPQQETPKTGDLDKLYSVVNQAGLYTKSKDEFLKKYSTPENIDKLHSVVSQAGLYTKSKDDFYNKYYPDLTKQQPLVTTPKEQPVTTQNLSFQNLTKTLPTGGVTPKKEGSWKNIVQNVAANVELAGTKLASGAANVVRDLSNKIVKEPELFDKGGNITQEALHSSWTNDPLGKIIVGLNGNKKRMEGVIQNNQLPNSFLGNVATSMSEIFPDIAATAALPETKIAEGASLAAKTLGTLGNTFTKYLAGKGALTGYDEAREHGQSMIEASKQGFKGMLKGAETGVEMAALGVGSNVATKSIMKQAEKIGLTGAKGIGAKELVNLSTDVAAYGLISPYAHSVVEGTPLTAHDIANGSGIAAAFRLKGTVETLGKHYELNRALKETNDLRQGVALSNFTDATPESIHEVYKMPESAEELNLKALQFTKEAKATTDVEKKQNLVAKAIMYTKASNVKGVTEQIQNNPQGLDEIYSSSDIPDDVKNQFLEKAIQVKNLIDNPKEAAQEQTPQTENTQQEPQLEQPKQEETKVNEPIQEQAPEIQQPTETKIPTTETVSEVVKPTEVAEPKDEGKVEHWFSNTVGNDVKKTSLSQDSKENVWGIQNNNGEYEVGKITSSIPHDQIEKRSSSLIEPLFNEDNIYNKGDKINIIKPAKLQKNVDGSFSIKEKGVIRYGDIESKTEQPKELTPNKETVEVQDRNETPIKIDDIGEGFVLHRGSEKGSNEGFHSIDKVGAEGYAGEKGKVVSSTIKKDANVLKLVSGDSEKYTDNEKGIEEFYKIIGEKERKKESEWAKGENPSDITTRLWNNKAAKEKLKKAGIDVVIGNTIDGVDAFVVNKDALETKTEPQKSVEVQAPKEEINLESKQHKENINNKFRKEFEGNGIPKEQVDGAIALMEARAKSWASEENGRNADDWYDKISDVKSGEFESNDIKYQNKKVSYFHSNTTGISGQFRLRNSSGFFGVYFSPSKKYSRTFGDQTYKTDLYPQKTLRVEKMSDFKDKYGNIFNITKEGYDKLIEDGYDSVEWYRDGKLMEFIALNTDIIGDRKLQFQGEKGALETLKNGKLVIHALNSPDFSTMVHEIGHVFESDLTDAEKKIVKDFGGSELFARGFEKYLRDGKAPTPELETLFGKFKEWLTNIYQTLKGSPIAKKITPEIKDIFDRLLTEKQTPTILETKVEEPSKQVKVNDLVDKTSGKRDIVPIKKYFDAIKTEEDRLAKANADDLENNKELEQSDEYINKLIDDYEQENGKQNTESSPEGKGNANKETSTGTSPKENEQENTKLETKSEIPQEVKDRVKKQIEDNTKVESISQEKIAKNSKDAVSDRAKQKEAMKDYSDFKKIIDCLYGIR